MKYCVVRADEVTHYRRHGQLRGIFGGCGLNLGQPGEGDAKKGESAVGAAGPPHVSSGQGTSSSCFVIRKVKISVNVVKSDQAVVNRAQSDESLFSVTSLQRFES